MGEISVYSNGTWVPNSELRIPVDDAGFLLGATVTERLRTFGGQIFRLNEHLERLRNSLQIVGLDANGIVNQVAEAIPEFLRRNRALIDAGDDWSVIAFATPGSAGKGSPTVCVHGYPLPFRSWASQFETGLPVIVSGIRQIPPNCLPPELKCRSRMHFYLADREAAAKRPGARAILLDQDGYVAEATTANVVLFRDAEGLLTPPSEHILFGVSVGVVRELSSTLSIPFVTRRITIDDLRSADEVMLTSTSVCVLPVVECDDQPIGSGKPGPVYRQLLAAWSELVAVDIADQARLYANRNT
jgi:branched-subunit amino acid aminotransferase/4-amino-4-deoxychorismate lyase